jgi:hypothetical protein
MRRFDAGAKRGKPERAFHFDGDGPGAITLAEGDFIEGGAAEAASGHKKGDGFQQIGLAGAVRPNQHNHVARDIELCRAIAAEVR